MGTGMCMRIYMLSGGYRYGYWTLFVFIH